MAIVGSKIQGRSFTSMIVDEAHTLDKVNVQVTKWEDRPTLLGELYCVDLVVSDYDMISARNGGKDYVYELASAHYKNLTNKLRAECPDCAMCLNLKVDVKERPNFERGEKHIQMTARCKLDNGQMSLECPNGRTAVRKGSLFFATPPDLMSPSFPAAADMPATEPYISHDPDTPHTVRDDAW